MCTDTERSIEYGGKIDEAGYADMGPNLNRYICLFVFHITPTQTLSIYGSVKRDSRTHTVLYMFNIDSYMVIWDQWVCMLNGPLTAIW